MKNYAHWHVIKQWSVQAVVVLLAMAWLSLVAASWSEGGELREPASDSSGNSDEFNFSWLDPDKKIYVLQNRKFLKSNRLMFNVMGGLSTTTAFRSTSQFEGRMNYHFKEFLGIEVFYTSFGNSENENFFQLTRKAGHALPNIREIQAQYGALLHYIPWYAKMNVFNQILYFDWYFCGGVGEIQSRLDTRASGTIPSQFVNEKQLGLFWGTGHHYYLSDHLSIRLDLTQGYFSAIPAADLEEKTWFSYTAFGIGLGYRL